MVKINGYTIQQIADLAEVPKITMYKFIVSGSYTETVGKRNTKLYSETVKDLIMADFQANKSKMTTPKIETVINSHTNFYSEDYISSLKDQIKQLQSFVDNQSEQLAALQKSLDQAQQLQLMAEQRLDNYHPQNIELSEFKNIKYSPSGFWSRLFKNR